MCKTKLESTITPNCLFNKEEMAFFHVPKSLICRYADEDISPEESDYRTDMMRDRDRVLYATAFRRLSGKTQIYTVGEDDHKRNRLTHTLEVAQIARTIASALGLDEYLAEAIALGHDFGHTPFGHAGEQMLNDIMTLKSSVVKGSPFSGEKKDFEERLERECKSKKDISKYAFGFKHNIQSLRVATTLEDSYRDINHNNIGLNLTNVTLYGMMSHIDLEYNNKPKEQNPNYQNRNTSLWSFPQQMSENTVNPKKAKQLIPAWSLEAFIVKRSDEIAQWHHDLEDALRGGAIPKDEIVRIITFAMNEQLSSNDSNLLSMVNSKKDTDRHVLSSLARVVVNRMVTDVIEHSRKNMQSIYTICQERKILPEDFFLHYEDFKFEMLKDDTTKKKLLKKDDIISFSSRINRNAFSSTIKEAVHHSKCVERMNMKGQYIIRKLFQAYYAHPQQLPDGPILHFLVDCKDEIAALHENDDETNPDCSWRKDAYDNIDNAKAHGIGLARCDLDKLMKNPNIYVQVQLMRRICDTIACMTDRYAIAEYENLYG